jgi:hypothetical protein
MASSSSAKLSPAQHAELTRPIGEPPAADTIAAAVASPRNTFRDPRVFGARPLEAATAAAWRLPDEPPWMKYFK